MSLSIEMSFLSENKRTNITQRFQEKIDQNKCNASFEKNLLLSLFISKQNKRV
jgi:hypothetical protein